MGNLMPKMVAPVGKYSCEPGVKGAGNKHFAVVKKVSSEEKLEIHAHRATAVGDGFEPSGAAVVELEAAANVRQRVNAMHNLEPNARKADLTPESGLVRPQRLSRLHRPWCVA